MRRAVPRPAKDLVRGVRRLLGRHSGQDEVLWIYRAMKARDPGVMLDVGAHFGGSCKRFASDGWRVLAFEPDPINRKELRRNVSGMANVTIDDRAVSNVDDETLTLYASKQSSGISSVHRFHDSHYPIAEVQTVRLSTVMEEYGLKIADFLKIDAEGHDLAVLKGFPWERTSPQVVICEYEDSKTQALGYCAEDIATYLEKLGYFVVFSEWYPIVRYGATHRRRVLTRDRTELDEKGWGNIIACRDPEMLASIERLAQGRRP